MPKIAVAKLSAGGSGSLGKRNAKSPQLSKFGFFDFSQARVLPLTYRDPMRFETMPSTSGERLTKLDALKNVARAYSPSHTAAKSRT
jgi:hypothetical protein